MSYSRHDAARNFPSGERSRDTICLAGCKGNEKSISTETICVSEIISFVLLRLTGSRTAGRRGIHPGVLQDFDQLATESADVLLDLVHIVLGDTLALSFSLLHRHVPSYQISHDALVPEVPLRGLLNLSLENKLTSSLDKSRRSSNKLISFIETSAR